MKTKVKPVSQDRIHRMKGITFSFELAFKQEDEYTYVPLSPPASPVSSRSSKSSVVGEYVLEPKLLQITSDILEKRLHKEPKPVPTQIEVPKCDKSITDALAIKFHINREKGVGRKRKLTYPASDIQCTWCKSNKTSQWRRGPGGSRTLCNVFCDSSRHVG
jgi:hypothetical protein